jgi:hypothetical protein
MSDEFDSEKVANTKGNLTLTQWVDYFLNDAPN